MSLMEFLDAAGRLKTTERRGWVLKDIVHPESVADHSFRTALLALLLAEDAGCNREKLITMALLHDLAESEVGDLTPHDSGYADKHQHERVVIARLATASRRPELLLLWEEAEARETPEAKLLHELDKLEMALQAGEYEQAHGLSLDEFWEDADRAIKSDVVGKIFETLKERRQKTR